jgi:tetratricopeptide (TPR) repeat protein
LSRRSPSPEPRPAKRSRKGGRTRKVTPGATTPGATQGGADVTHVEKDAATGEPRVIGPYRVLRVLGEGGMGTVYKAEQIELGRQVAVKLIRSALVGPDAALRFASERQAMARMHHPYIAQVFDAGTTNDGQPYIAMEYIPGLPISRHCETRKPSLMEMLRLFITVAQALLHAHQKGTIHRDIKPSNILIMEVDGRAIPKVIDFGIAKIVDRTVALTDVGAVVGTVAYMSPEQIRGATVDHRSDIYSYGVMIHELLTGQLPAVAPKLEAALWQGYPPELRRIVDRCLEVDPDERFDGFGDLIEAVGALLDDQRSAVRGESAAEVGRDEELGRRLMGELWKLFEAPEEPSLTETLELLEEAVETPPLLRDMVTEARRLDERRHRAHNLESRLVEAIADCRLALALAVDHRSRDKLLKRGAKELRRILGDLKSARDAEACCHLGDALSALGEIDAAVEVYCRATELAADLPRAFYGLAAACTADRDRLEEALSACWKTISLASHDAPSHNNLGIALYLSQFQPEVSLFGRDKLIEATTSFRRAAELDPSLAVAHRNLGLALHQQGEFQGAVEAFWKAIDLSQGSQGAEVLKVLLAEASGERLNNAINEQRLLPEGIMPHSPGEEDDADADEARKLARRGRLDRARAAFVRSEKLYRDTGESVA